MTAEKDGARGRFFLRQFVGVVGVGGGWVFSPLDSGLSSQFPVPLSLPWLCVFLISLAFSLHLYLEPGTGLAGSRYLLLAP